MIATGDTFTLTAAILAVAAVIGFVANRARQPLIVAFIAVGILYSYRGSPFVKDQLHLLYGAGSLFIMGLGIRAMYL